MALVSVGKLASAMNVTTRWVNKLVEEPLASAGFPIGQIAGSPPKHQPAFRPAQFDHKVSVISRPRVLLKLLGGWDARIVGVETRSEGTPLPGPNESTEQGEPKT